MALSDDDDIAPLSNARALERADHKKEEKADKQKSAKEEKQLFSLQRSVLMTNVNTHQGQKDSEKKRQEAVFKTQTLKEQEEDSVQTADKKATPDTVIKDAKEHEMAEQQAEYEQDQSQAS